jgi:alanyl-tRNA synthetase
LFQPLLPPPSCAAVCDYLLPHESIADGVRRIEELLGNQALAEVKQHRSGSNDDSDARAAAQPFCRESSDDNEQGERMPEKTWHALPSSSSSSSSSSSATAITTASSAANNAHASSNAKQSTATAVKATSSDSGNAHLLPIAFGVLALALSVAFFTHMM